VVIADQLDLVGLDSSLYATLGIGLIAPEFDATHLRRRIIVQRTGLGCGEADGQGLLRGRGCCAHGNRRGQEEESDYCIHWVSSDARYSKAFRTVSARPRLVSAFQL